MTNRPVSNAGDAMGPSSVVIWKIPSKGRSENGFATSAETLASTLETCQCHNSLVSYEPRKATSPRLAQLDIGKSIVFSE